MRLSEQRFDRGGKENLSAIEVSETQEGSSSESSTDDLTFRGLLLIVWKQKFKLGAITALFGVVSTLYALSLPNIYTSTIKLVPSQEEQAGGLSSLASRYGGLAAMAGINLGGASGSNSVRHAVELMHSWPYIDSVITKHNLKPVFIATKGWSASKNELIYDEDLYDVSTKQWLDEKPFIFGEAGTAEPTSFETFKKIQEQFLKVSWDDELGIFEMSVSHYSPEVAYNTANLLKFEINEFFRIRDQKEARASIDFIEREIQKTQNTQMREVFYSMIESHTQTLMLTEINKEYLLKTLVPAKVSNPKDKSKPKRSLIVVLSVFIGFFISLLIFVFVSMNNISSTNKM